MPEIEVTRVTAHDAKGRIKAFEKHVENRASIENRKADAREWEDWLFRTLLKGGKGNENAEKLYGKLAKSVGSAIVELIAESVDPLLKRIAELEARPIPKYCGVWNKDTRYEAGSFVTWSGSIWHAEVANNGHRPDSGAKGVITDKGVEPIWRLAVKKGRDAR